MERRKLSKKLDSIILILCLLLGSSPPPPDLNELEHMIRIANAINSSKIQKVGETSMTVS